MTFLLVSLLVPRIEIGSQFRLTHRSLFTSHHFVRNVFRYHILINTIFIPGIGNNRTFLDNAFRLIRPFYQHRHEYWCPCFEFLVKTVHLFKLIWFVGIVLFGFVCKQRLKRHRTNTSPCSPIRRFHRQETICHDYTMHLGHEFYLLPIQRTTRHLIRTRRYLFHRTFIQFLTLTGFRRNRIPSSNCRIQFR